MVKAGMKTISLVLVVILSLGMLLSGCGGKAPAASTDTGKTEVKQEPAKEKEKEAAKPAAKTKIKVFLWIGEDRMKEIITEFNKEFPDITVEYSQAPAVQPYLEKLKTMLITNQAPDVFYCLPENISDLHAGGYCMDLTNESFAANLNDLNRKLYSRDGKLLGASAGNWVGGIVYNKTVFKKAGITKEPDTLDELAEDMKKIKDIGILPFANQFQDASLNLLTGVFASNVVEFVPDHQDQIYAGTKTNADFWTEPMKLFNDMFVKPGYVSAKTIGIPEDKQINDFAQDKLGMYLGGVWTPAQIEKANPKCDYAIMGVPGSKPGAKWYFGGPLPSYAVYSKTQQKEAAMKFMNWVHTANGGKVNAKVLGDFQTLKDYQAPLDPHMGEAAKSVVAGKQYLPLFWWTKNTETLRKTYVDNVQKMILGKMTPEEVAKSLDTAK
ncbi:MAG: extracellular solute-binding protein [Clostridia bacterium]|nr:extracellular solute-binding protein [Clostridia bacterium]